MNELLAIDVNRHTEKKGELTYLSWAWAWAEVLKLDPAATWDVIEFDNMPMSLLPDETAMVKVSVTIKGDCKSCWLPVMDNRNKAIARPNAMDVNKAIMRCLAKAVAIHGLGLYIYAGEDLPEIDYFAVFKAAQDLPTLKGHFAAAWKMTDKAEQPSLKAAYDKRTNELTTKEAA